jgi:hypothetical protein
MKRIALLVTLGVWTLAFVTLPAGAAPSSPPAGGPISWGPLPPIVGPAPNPPPGGINPGGPMQPGPGKVHCDCLRLVDGHAVSCCP